MARRKTAGHPPQSRSRAWVCGSCVRPPWRVALGISGRLPLGTRPRLWPGTPGAQRRGPGMLSGSTGASLFLRPAVLCIQMGRSLRRAQRPRRCVPHTWDRNEREEGVRGGPRSRHLRGPKGSPVLGPKSRGAMARTREQRAGRPQPRHKG